MRARGRPAWGEEIRAVWARRRNYYESLCTHTIASLTARPAPPSPQFQMKHVETAFVRLLRSIFGFASSHVPLVAGPRPAPTTGPSSGEYGGYGACESELGRGAKGPRTSFVALNFPNLLAVEADVIRQVAGGVDVIEMRVDTLVEPERVSSALNSRAASPNGAAVEAGPDPTRAPARYPSQQFVAMCFGHLRRCSPLPILYTVRTESQGGVFPDPYPTAASPSPDPALLESYLALVELGIKLGAEYVDVELALPDASIERFVQHSGSATRILGADHDRRGEWDWESQEVLDKYLRAKRLGCDVVKLVSTPTAFKSNLDLLNFRAKVDAIVEPEDSANANGPSEFQTTVPLLAINLGKGGQISRYLNPVLTPVTHPLLPGVAAPGQITFQQTQQALFLSGLTLEKTFLVSSEQLAELFTREAARLGLPYAFQVGTFGSGTPIVPNFGGSYVFPLGDAKAAEVQSLPLEDEVLPPAAATGYADLCVPACTEPLSYDVPPTSLGHSKHTNVRVLALAELITQNLSPINAVGTHTCALLVGLDKKDRAEVVEALRMVGARWVFVLACEADDGDVVLMSTDGSGPVSRAGSPMNGDVGAAVTPSRPGTPSGSARPATGLPYPQHAPLNVVSLSSFSTPALYSKRPPTIIISSDRFFPVARNGRDEHEAAPAFPEKLFCSPTGGCALDLSLSFPRTKQGILSSSIRRRRARTPGAASDGWQVLGKRDLQAECEKQAFRALTGRRLN